MRFFKVNDQVGINLDKIIYWTWSTERGVNLVVYFDHAVSLDQEPSDSENLMDRHTIQETRYFGFTGEEAYRVRNKLESLCEE